MKYRLTESDLKRIVRKVINEQSTKPCAEGTQGTLKLQNGVYGLLTPSGFCSIPATPGKALSSTTTSMKNHKDALMNSAFN